MGGGGGGFGAIKGSESNNPKTVQAFYMCAAPKINGSGCHFNCARSVALYACCDTNSAFDVDFLFVHSIPYLVLKP